MRNKRAELILKDYFRKCPAGCVTVGDFEKLTQSRNEYLTQDSDILRGVSRFHYEEFLNETIKNGYMKIRIYGSGFHIQNTKTGRDWLSRDS